MLFACLVSQICPLRVTATRAEFRLHQLALEKKKKYPQRLSSSAACAQLLHSFASFAPRQNRRLTQWAKFFRSGPSEVVPYNTNNLLLQSPIHCASHLLKLRKPSPSASLRRRPCKLRWRWACIRPPRPLAQSIALGGPLRARSLGYKSDLAVFFLSKSLCLYAANSCSRPVEFPAAFISRSAYSDTRDVVFR